MNVYVENPKQSTKKAHKSSEFSRSQNRGSTYKSQSYFYKLGLKKLETTFLKNTTHNSTKKEILDINSNKTCKESLC